MSEAQRRVQLAALNRALDLVQDVSLSSEDLDRMIPVEAFFFIACSTVAWGHSRSKGSAVFRNSRMRLGGDPATPLQRSHGT